MDEPVEKKMKIAEENDFSFVFAEENHQPDRVLLVENLKFSVQSDVLMKHSEYFRLMFGSNFVEKDKEEIELKDLKADLVKQFLVAVYRPNAVDASDLEDEDILDVFFYFQACSYLVEFIGKRDEFSFPSVKLLQIAVDRQQPELRNAVDKYLAEMFVSAFPMNRKKFKYAVKTFKFDVLVIDSLDLFTEFSLVKLQDAVDSHLTAEYARCKHLRALDTKFVELLSKYRLAKLTKAVEQQAISRYTNPPYSVDDVRKQYFLPKPALIELTELKNTVEQNYLNRYDQMDPMLVYVWEAMAEICNTCGLDTLRKKVEDDMVKNLELKTNSMFFRPWRDFTELIKFDTEAQSSIFVMWLKNADVYGLHKFKAALEEFAMDGFRDLAGTGQVEILYPVYVARLRFAVPAPVKTKDTLLDFLVEQFSDPHTMHFKNMLVFCLQNSERQKLQELKNAIDSYLFAAYERRGDNQDYLSEDDFFNLSFRFNLPTLKRQFELSMVAEFECEKENVAKFAERCRKYDVPKLKDAVESQLIHDFNENRSFINLHLAFGYNLNKFKEAVTKFLKTAICDDPVMKAGRKYILKMAPKQQLCVLRIILRKSEEDDDSGSSEEDENEEPCIWVA